MENFRSSYFIIIIIIMASLTVAIESQNFASDNVLKFHKILLLEILNFFRFFIFILDTHLFKYTYTQASIQTYKHTYIQYMHGN